MIIILFYIHDEKEKIILSSTVSIKNKKHNTSDTIHLNGFYKHIITNADKSDQLYRYQSTISYDINPGYPTGLELYIQATK